MLPTLHRLTKKKDFQEVFKNGQSLKNDFLLCKVLKGRTAYSRFGFVVSKKISVSAVVRNKVKRQLRSAVLKNLSTLSSPVDVIVVALPPVKKKTFLDMEDAVTVFFKKINR
jgi:ribonuclease P protein component